MEYLLSDRFVAENISVSIAGRSIVTNATISMTKGNITGLLGRNGSGKSTMLKAVYGTQKAGDLNIHVNGRPVRRAYSEQRLINYLPQWNFLPANLKVEQVLRQYNVGTEKILEDMPELEDDLKRRISELSGGRERLWSTLLLIYSDTEYTMLDEPFTHLAPVHIGKLKEILLREKQRKGILITDHMYSHLLELSDMLYLMKDGSSMNIRHQRDLSLHGYIKSV